MSIEEKQKIDFIGVRKTSGEVILSISDHLDWDAVLYHLATLQDKLNDYIEFIESGQIYDEYPNSKGKKLVIEIVSKEDYHIKGLEFLEKVMPIVNSIGADLRQRTLTEE
jgi:hypothetical protein